MEYTITPYTAVGPLKFGATPAEVEQILGKPDVTTEDFLGRKEEIRKEVSVKYEKNKMSEVSFLKGAQVIFDGMDLFNTKGVVKLLQEKYSSFSGVGFVVFDQLGIAFSDFKKITDNSAVSVFSKKTLKLYDELKD